MMPDARKTPETGSTGNRLEQVLQHPEHASDSAEQLRDELADLMFSTTEYDFDEERFDALLSALDQAAPLPEDALPDPRESLAAFHREHDADQNPVGPAFHSSKRFSGHLTFRKLFPAAAVIVLLVCLMTPQASGRNLLQELGRWTAEIFQLKDDTDNYAVIRNRPLEEGETRTYDTPQEMLDDFGLTAKLVPTWVPERLGEPEVWAKSNSESLYFRVDYEYGDDFLSIYFTEMIPQNLRTTEKDHNNADTKKLDGIPHYIIIDKNITKIIWENGELECHITGNLPYEEMEQILYSVYED